jgi:hypothetical protein
VVLSCVSCCAVDGFHRVLQSCCGNTHLAWVALPSQC